MKTTIKIGNRIHKTNLSEPIDISLPLSNTERNVKAWYVSNPRFEPVRMGDWIGDVKQGGSVNFKDLYINPHGHGTHTECVGHISKEDYTINKTLTRFFFLAQLITIQPEVKDSNSFITKEQVEKLLIKDEIIEALILRTLPNIDEKISKNYSNTNPPYITPEACQLLADRKIKHFLLDLPSVDPEVDGGKLLAHRAFWQYPENTRLDATITELIYVPNKIVDGVYLLNIQIASLENDASPSKPVLYKIG